MHIEPHYSLFEHNTFRIKSNARWRVTYESLDDLDKLSRDEYFHSLPFIAMGMGSNLLFVGDYHGIVLHSAIYTMEIIPYSQIETNGINKNIKAEFPVLNKISPSSLSHLPPHFRNHKNIALIRVGSGVLWDDFVAKSLAKGWYGIENLSGIPGTVGASAVQNIGAYGSEVSQYIYSVETFDLKNGKTEILYNKDCSFGYRYSVFKSPPFSSKVITHVTYALCSEFVPNLSYKALADFFGNKNPISAQEQRDAVLFIRNGKLPDPKILPNAGSFFQNPIISNAIFEDLKKTYPKIPFYPVSDKNKVKLSAAWLIDQSGFKGKREGQVGCYDKQPLVLVNYGVENGSEIMNFASTIVDAVMRKFSIHLEPEVRYIIGKI